MTIQFESINEKTLKDGHTDLLSKVWSLRNANVTVLELVLIDKLTAMRLDLFCMAYYNSVADLELFLKVNGVVNPFEEPIGKILIMPEMTTLRKSMENINLDTILSNRINTVDAEGNFANGKNGKSSVSNKKTRMDMTRTIGFKKLENGNLIF